MIDHVSILAAVAVILAVSLKLKYFILFLTFLLMHCTLLLLLIDIPDDCPSSSALRDGHCTPSSQPSATTSKSPSSQPSTSPVSGQGPDVSRDLCNTLLDQIFDLFLFSNAKEEAIKVLVCGVEN